jgi:hypothetical protein
MITQAVKQRCICSKTTTDFPQHKNLFLQFESDHYNTQMAMGGGKKPHNQNTAI